ncbi:MAG: nucleotide sugar dehydrogenase [Gammaproteobacteria bacterium]|nr:nucleotide sugar dehydrogenase [Gammaproteobacteria bacterium]
MEISVFGLGYVGCVSAACFAANGHNVLGVDLNATKVDLINQGISPIVEPGLSELISVERQRGRLRATGNCSEAVTSTELSFVCIGTPSAPNGSLDLRFVIRVAEEIGAALHTKADFHLVIFRSTMLPRTMEQVVLPAIVEASGKQAGKDFGIAYHPEFLREGSAIADFRNPPRTVIGAIDQRSGDLLASLYAGLAAPLVRCDLRTAELVKYSDNVFHALKVAFGNEIGAICRLTGVNSHQLMEIFCLDTKLNLSSTYLKPGFAFGGSCLPKDLRALTHLARKLDLQVPVLEATLASNTEHKRRAFALVTSQGKKKIGLLGLSFKDGTDDLRESPTVELVEQLIGKGYSVCIHDRYVALAKLTGANKAYIAQEIPHIASLLVPDIPDLLSASDVVVVTRRSPEYADVVNQLRPDQTMVDLVRHYAHAGTLLGERYHALVG